MGSEIMKTVTIQISERFRQALPMESLALLSEPVQIFDAWVFLATLKGLADTPDNFPTGKWAVIQHIEGQLIEAEGGGR
jgi:hypothetical protein